MSAPACSPCRHPHLRRPGRPPRHDGLVSRHRCSGVSRRNQLLGTRQQRLLNGHAGIARSAAAQPAAPEQHVAARSAASALPSLAVGLVAGQAVTWLGLIILLVSIVRVDGAGLERTGIQRPKYNASIRKRLLHPIEFPVLGGSRTRARHLFLLPDCAVPAGARPDRCSAASPLSSCCSAR